MALPVCQFVDRVGSGAVQRLNLNDGKNLSLLQGPEARPGPDFSPPALKRSVVNTLLVEGASIPASAYNNRLIRLPLRVKACDEGEMAEILETLHRELDRGNNILKWQPTYNHPAVYFRTFRSPDYRLDQTMEGRGELKVTLAIVAEPFGYGDYVESTGTIYNDPAAVANGIHFEIVATEGDVPTPLWLFIDNVNVPLPEDAEFLIASRRHGTPVLYFAQAEAMVQGANTTPQPNNPIYSGAGNNFSLTTFAAPAMDTRLTWTPAPGAGSDDDYRGLYRLFVRVQRSDNTSVFRLRVGPTLPAPWGDEVELALTLNMHMVDLGLFPIPRGPDPVSLGYSGTVMPAENLAFFLQAERVAGAGTLNWDYAVLVPADEELAMANLGPAGPLFDNWIFDGPNDKLLTSDGILVQSFEPVSLVGSLPLVTPNQTNLYVSIWGLSINNLIPDTVDYVARYWPRHLYIR